MGSSRKRLVHSSVTGSSVAVSWYLLHLDREDFAFQLGPGWQQGCHRSRQPDMTAECADLHHEFVAFFEQFDFALGGERHKNTNLINTVLFPEGVGFLRPGHGRWIFVLRDRKSTRLNSSHLGISYAVFC